MRGVRVSSSTRVPCVAREHELVGALVVEVDEACVGAEGVRDFARDELEHLLQVERRVDRSDGLGEEAEMTGRRVQARALSPDATSRDAARFTVASR